MTLIERLEAASGPDRELDCLIENALGIAKFERAPRMGYGDADYNRVAPKPYTASIDAALTLVPAHMRDEINITTMYQVARVAINLNHGPDDGPHYGSHACNSIPLALCIAALRAQEADRG